MPLRFAVAVLRCDIGDPPGRPPPLAAYEAVIGPDGAWSALDGWSRATFGYLDLSGSRVIPDILEIEASELINEGGPERDASGALAYSMSRQKVGDRGVALAEEAGWDMSVFDGVVVIARQGALTHEGLPVRPYRGGASALSDGRKMCNLAHDATLYLIAHEIGHVFGFPESFGLRSRAWSWNEAPFDLTPAYGDPFCVMSASVRHGGGAFDYLQASPLSPDWPAATFSSAGPGPALALIRQVHPRALTENRCVRRLTYDEWHAPNPSIRLFPASDGTAGRTKLLVLDGPRRTGPDPEGTIYVEYRRPDGLDQGLTVDASGTGAACAALVVHELKDTRLCVPTADDNRTNPACVADDGAVRARGRLLDDGLRAHFRARIPVPAPLSRDWRAGDDGPVLRVSDAAADGSWVEVGVSAATGPARRSVYFLPIERRDVARTVAFRGREELPVLCGGVRPSTGAGGPARPGQPGTRPLPTGGAQLVPRYTYTIDLVDQEVTLRVAVAGFGNDQPVGVTGDNPRLTWSLSGTPVTAPAAGGPDSQRGAVLNLPVHRYDLATGESVPSGPGSVALHAKVAGDGSLVLRTSGASGSFNLPVTVTATDPGSGASTSNSVTVLVTGHQLRRDAGLLKSLRACLRRIQDPSRLNQFTTPPWERMPRWSQRLSERVVTRPDRFALADVEDLNLATAAYLKLRASGDLAGAREVAAVADRAFGVNVSLAARL